jgi:hypothetical protein
VELYKDKENQEIELKTFDPERGINTQDLDINLDKLKEVESLHSTKAQSFKKTHKVNKNSNFDKMDHGGLIFEDEIDLIDLEEYLKEDLLNIDEKTSEVQQEIFEIMIEEMS